MMWTLIIALVIGTGPAPITFTPLATVATYEQCRDLARLLKANGLNDTAHLYCVSEP